MAGHRCSRSTTLGVSGRDRAFIDEIYLLWGFGLLGHRWSPGGRKNAGILAMFPLNKTIGKLPSRPPRKITSEAGP